MNNSGDTLFAIIQGGHQISLDGGKAWTDAALGLPAGNVSAWTKTDSAYYILAAGAVWVSRTGAAWVPLVLPNPFPQITGISGNREHLYLGTVAGAYSVGNSASSANPLLLKSMDSVSQIKAGGSAAFVRLPGKIVYLKYDDTTWFDLPMPNSGDIATQLNAAGDKVYIEVPRRNDVFYSRNLGASWDSIGVHQYDSNDRAAPSSSVFKILDTSWISWTYNDYLGMHNQLFFNGAAKTGVSNDGVFVRAAFCSNQGKLFAAAGAGIWTSVDSAKTWVLASKDSDSVVISKIVGEDSSLFVFGHYGANDNGGFSSNDGGVNWKNEWASEIEPKMLVGYADKTPYYTVPGHGYGNLGGFNLPGQVTCCVGPDRFDGLIVSGKYVFISANLPGGYLMESDDSGASFTIMNHGLGTDTNRILAIALHKNTIIAATSEGLFSMARDSASWNPLNASTPMILSEVASNGDAVYGIKAGILYASLNDGQDWGVAPLEYIGDPIISLLVTGNRVYAATSRGVYWTLALKLPLALGPSGSNTGKKRISWNPERHVFLYPRGGKYFDPRGRETTKSLLP